MKEDKVDKILDLMEQMHISNTQRFQSIDEQLSDVKKEIQNNRQAIEQNRKEIEVNRHLIEGVQRGLDHVTSNYTKVKSHIALKEGVEEIAQHVGLDLDFSAA